MLQDNVIINDIFGKIWSIGQQEYGQCGIDDNVFRVEIPTNINLFELNNLNLKKICCNPMSKHIFWITDGHLIYGNGYNEYYQLGIGQTKNIGKPQLIQTLSLKNVIIDVQCAHKYSNALDIDGNVYSTKYVSISMGRTWKQIHLLKDIKINKIATGEQHSLFLQSNGILMCQGINNHGQLGLNNTTNCFKIVKMAISMSY